MYRKAILPSALLSLVAAGLVLVSTPGQAQAQRGAIYGGVRIGGVGIGGFSGGGYYGGGLGRGYYGGDFGSGYYGGGLGRGYYGSGYYGGGFGSGYYGSGYYGRGYNPGYGYGYARGYGSPYASTGLAYSYPSTTYSYPSMAYSYPSTTYSYPSSAYVVPQSNVVLSTSGYSPVGADSAASTSAVITARVPEDAEVWCGDYKTNSTGAVRTFESPPLQAGRDYTYTIRARWQQDGREVNQTRKIDVQPGSRVSVEFPRPEE